MSSDQACSLYSTSVCVLVLCYIHVVALSKKNNTGVKSTLLGLPLKILLVTWNNIHSYN